MKTEKHKAETSGLLNSLLPLPANMERGLLYRIAGALLYPFVNSSWAGRQALLERSYKTPLALSSRPPHTLQLEEDITSHFHHHYWRVSFSISAILSVDVFVNVTQASSILDEFVKVRRAPKALWMSPLLCVCFMPLLELHIFCVWDWRIMENCHLCDKLLFSPIKHRKCSLRGSHTIMLSHLGPAESQQGASGWNSVRRLNLFKTGELESFQKKSSWSHKIIVLTGLWKGGWHLMALSEAWYLFALICNKVPLGTST